MRKSNRLYLLCFFLLFIVSETSYAINANDIAVVDYYLAFCLHPKMALYDYNRCGFYKVGFGLSSEEFETATSNLKQNPPENIIAEKNKLEKQLAEISEKKRNEHDNLAYDKLCCEEEALRKDFEKILWNYNNNDITNTEETKEIFQEIIKDINSAVEETYKENNFAIVLNSSFTHPYPSIPRSNESVMQGYCVPGLNSLFFYGLYNKNYIDNAGNGFAFEKISDLYWNELINSCGGCINEYELFPYPVILSGGNSITSVVINKIYRKYSINLAIQELLNSVIIKVEALKYGKELTSDRKKMLQENNK